MARPLSAILSLAAILRRHEKPRTGRGYMLKYDVVNLPPDRLDADTQEEGSMKLNDARLAPRRASSKVIDAVTAPIAPASEKWESGRMYAIAFDMDTDILRSRLGETAYTGAWHAIRAVFLAHGFAWQQGSVYFGGKDTNPVSCVLAVQDASKKYSWFRDAVKDIRMLRIEENNDLSPALGEPELPLG